MVAEDLSGKQFGDLKVIGDTGKRNKNGMQIVIARDSKGNIHEYLASNIKNGFATGFKKSELNKVNGRKWAIKTHGKTIRDGYNISLLKNSEITFANKTGYKYVFYNDKSKRWKVEIKFKNNNYGKEFTCFKDAVMYSFELRKKYILPLLNKEEQRNYLDIFNKEIIINYFAKEKQKEINFSLIENEKKKIKKNIERYKSSKGITFDKSKNRWVARIKINNKTKHLGYFDNEQDAINARQKAVEEQIKILKKQLEEL